MHACDARHQRPACQPVPCTEQQVGTPDVLSVPVVRSYGTLPGRIYSKWIQYGGPTLHPTDDEVRPPRMSTAGFGAAQAHHWGPTQQVLGLRQEISCRKASPLTGSSTPACQPCACMRLRTGCACCM